MNGNQPPPLGQAQPIDAFAFKKTLENPAISRDFFLPLAHAHWGGGERYTLGQADRRPAIPQITGVRFQEPDPNHQDLSREKATQTDLAALVRSVTELRKTPGLSGAVLSDEFLIGKQPGQADVKRAVFGLHNPANGQYKNDADAARACHSQITRAINKAGFQVEGPATFDPQAGLAGLAGWAGQVRLRRRQRPLWPYLAAAAALLLLLPLMWLLFRGKSAPSSSTPPVATQPPKIFGMELKSQGFIILVDKSSSMQPYFSKVRSEAKRLLNDLLQRQKNSKGSQEFSANVILYDSDAYSSEGGLRKLDEGMVGKLGGYLDQMKAGGGTNLNRAIELAAQEASRYGKKTTLFIITDGEDNTISSMVRDKDAIKRQFGSAEVVFHTTTPRLFDPSSNPAPAGIYESNLKEFSETFNGRFGPSQAPR